MGMKKLNFSTQPSQVRSKSRSFGYNMDHHQLVKSDKSEAKEKKMEINHSELDNNKALQEIVNRAYNTIYDKDNSIKANFSVSVDPELEGQKYYILSMESRDPLSLDSIIDGYNEPYYEAKKIGINLILRSVI